ncbi:LuxR C-terminal-related transcriptional regulator [Microcella sp.]|uniref:LuxR C-terminal-related transcriptional regulator n=1 Tax=Microcella sp. TaxID=1913979 RepID=UPI003F6EEC8F
MSSLPPESLVARADGLWPLVGRSAHLAKARAALESGRVALVVLSGEAGVGKTRLASELTVQLERDGWRGNRIVASASLSAVPLAALIPLMGATRQDIARIGADTATLMAFAAELAARRSAEGPLLVVVDDLPQLDPLSVAVLAQLGSSGAITLLATARDGEPLPEPMVALWTSDRALRIPIGPLSVDDIDALLPVVLGNTVAHQTVVALHGASGGNPLFLRELVAHALATCSITQHHGSWVLQGAPGGSTALGELIASRLSGLAAAQLDVMERLAVCQSIPLSQFTEPESRTALGELEQQQLVQLRPEAGRYVATIAHPQYAAAMQSRVPTLRRIDLLLDHAARAEDSPERDVDAVRIATWRLDAGAPGDAAFLGDAARLALLTEDFELVARLATAAEQSGTVDTELLLIHADALTKLGRVDDALAALARARELDEAAPVDQNRTARILTMTTTALITGSGRFDEALALLDGAAERLPEAARRVRQARARILVGLERPRDALAELERIPDGATVIEQAELDLNTAVPYVALGRTDDALRTTERALAAARLVDATIPLRVAYLMRAVSLAQACRLEEARSHAADALAEAIVLDDALRSRQAEFTLAAVYLAMGRLETAARWLKDVIAGARTRGPRGYEALGRGVLARVRAQQGLIADARAVLAEIPEALIEEDSLLLLGWAWVEALDGNAAAARERVAMRTRQRVESGDLDFASILALDLARLGDAPAAADLLDGMLAEADSPVVRLRARTARAMAASDAPALQDAAAEWERHGYLLHAAESFALAADAARREGRGRDAAQLVGRARTLAERTEGASTSPLQFATELEPLTPREREIATLAARGLASNDIATRLFLSPRTVNNHLQSAYSKLGVRSRSELPAALGLASPDQALAGVDSSTT